MKWFALSLIWSILCASGGVHAFDGLAHFLIVASPAAAIGWIVGQNERNRR